MRRSRLSQYKQNKLIELFVAGVTARTATQLVGVNKNTAAYYFHRLRLLIFHSSPHLEMFDGEVEADESYFGGHRKGKRGRGAAGKVAVFGLLKRNGKVYTVAVPNTQTATLLPIIREQVKPDSIVYTDCYKSYDVLDVSEFSHLRINHSTHFAERQNHINGIENFWNQAKRHLRKFNGIPKEHFELYLKECEWRFNNSEIKVQISILKQLVKHDLFWLSRTAPNKKTRRFLCRRAGIVAIIARNICSQSVYIRRCRAPVSAPHSSDSAVPDCPCARQYRNVPP